MILLDKPYVSDYLQKTILENNIPVVQTPNIDDLELRSDLNYISEKDALRALEQDPDTRVYSNSENAIHWIRKHKGFDELSAKIELFKDKVLFRELIRPLYPDYYFKSLQLNNLNLMKEVPLNYPLILKPAVGFFSMGVYKLNSVEDWATVNKKISNELEQVEHLYPIEVFNSSKYILEACIDGREFAIDAYFNDLGEPVILNIMEHYFSSSEDVGDRLYSTSAILMRQFLSAFGEILQSIGKMADLKSFPVHLEVRITDAGEIIPIEVNPLRFGGWCTTADLAGMAYGFNPYEMYFSNQEPDWDVVLRDKENKTYNIFLLDNTTGLEGRDIYGFDYDKLSSRFSKVLDIRKVDYTLFPVFGFLFVEATAEESDVIEELLRSDLSEYLLDK